MKRWKAVLGVLGLSLVIGIGVGCSGDNGTDSTENTETESNSEEVVSSEDVLSTESEVRDIYSNPDNFKGQRLDFTAKIFMEPERDSDGVYFQCYAFGNSNLNTIVAFTEDIDLNDGDYVHIKGEVGGAFEGENLMGGKVIAPTIMATSVEVVDYGTAMAPAIEVKEVNQEINQHGFLMKLEKVEFAEQETRAYLTIENQSQDSLSFYSFNAKAVQGSTQIQQDDNWEADYKDINSDILPGVTEKGVVVFEKANPDEAITFYFEGRSDDYSTNFEDFVFEVQ